jgi:hypothetical protein
MPSSKLRQPRFLAPALMSIALAGCAGTQAELPQPPAPQPTVATAPALTAKEERMIAAARADTAELRTAMNGMLAKQAQMQEVMLVMLDTAMSPEVLGSLMESARRFETAFADARPLNEVSE